MQISALSNVSFYSRIKLQKPLEASAFGFILKEMRMGFLSQLREFLFPKCQEIVANRNQRLIPNIQHYVNSTQQYKFLHV